MPDQERRWLIGIAEAPREYLICQRIRESGVELYLPIEHKQQRAGRGKVRDIVQPILRPYFFVPASISDYEFSYIRHSRGVRGFLEIDGKPAVMRESELTRVRYQEDQLAQRRRRRIIESGQGPHFIVGEAVEITVGSVRVEGTVYSVGLARAEVKLNGITIFGRDVVEVDLTHIAPAPM